MFKQKKSSPLSQQPLSKNQDLVKSPKPFCQEAQPPLPPAPTERGGMHTMSLHQVMLSYQNLNYFAHSSAPYPLLS